ncbi:hypothetical protein [Allomuricauda sp. R78024]|uniref:hypothetical protein n=1 Tax=Allomuricauda sp. R78024 TaxID=3093867 RepID=UPI0037CB3289
MKEDHKNKFKTPEGYFDSFHERLMDKINEEENEQGKSIIPKSDGFSVPEEYFDTFKVETKEAKVVQLKSYKKFYYSAAAIAAIFILIFGLTWKTDAPITFEDLVSAEIDAYFETTELDMSTYEIAEVVSLNSLEVNDVLDNALKDENILEYLDENVEDIEDLNLDYNYYE